MNIFEGLFFYEIALLILGVLLFLVLLFLLILFALRNKPIKPLLPFFVLPLVMIGFPGIQKVRFADGLVDIETKSTYVRNNPDDEAARRELAEAVETVAERSGATEIDQWEKLDTRVLEALAKGNEALGNDSVAFDLAVVATKKDPNARGAAAVVERAGVRQLENILAVDTGEVMDAASRRNITRVTAGLEKVDTLSSESYITLANAYDALGKKEEAEAILDSAKKKQPGLQIDSRLLRPSLRNR